MTTAAKDAFATDSLSAVDELVSSMGIPARPSVLIDISEEMGKEEPDPRTLTRLVLRDVALSAALLKIANSAGYGLSRQVDTVEQAVRILGLQPTVALVTGLVLRQVLKPEGASLVRFWDVSDKRSMAMRYLAKHIRGVGADVAQTFGLFCDVGIPILSRAFKPHYMQTLSRANADPNRTFTEVERTAHGADHAEVGAMLARTWGTADLIVKAIRLHHDYSIYEASSIAKEVKTLCAMGLVAEHVIQRYAGLNASAEWAKGGAAALGFLGADHDVLAEWADDVHELFMRDEA